ncbi:MAG: EAL domain-containing protein [Sulfurimonas sp.]|nr:EAL domain-containing protein [Sulfurimonas sp.]
MELALTGSNTSIVDWNLTNNEFYLSPSWKEMLGYKDNELPNIILTWRQRVHKDDKRNLFSSLRRTKNEKKEYFENTHRLKHKDGHWVWILGRAQLLYNENGTAVRMIGTHADITKEKELQLKYSQQAQMIEQIHDSVISTDLEGTITSCNYGTELLLGYKSTELVGKPITTIYLEEDFEILSKNIETVKKDGEHHTTVRLVKKSQEVIDTDLSLSLIKDEKGNVVELVGYSQDITKRKKAEAELLKQKDILDHQAHHDALTGLANRILFNDRLEQSLKKAKRSKSKIAVLFIDLDHFKEINDSLGHAVGDDILKIVTKRLNSTIRNEDSIARLGGDEFVVMVDGLAQGQNASLLAQKILTVLAEPITLEGHILYVSSSIGISLYPDDGASTDDLLKYADAAMYKAKAEGRNNFQFYCSEMTELAFERVVMEASLRAALKNGDFIVYYQPQIDAKKNKLVGMEALVRWKHTTMGMISPAKFIPLAETTGLIIELDQFVMRTAMRQIVQWYKDGLNPGKLALNLAVKQLQQKDFIDTLQNMLRETECKAEWIELEVTEGKIMHNPEDAIVVLNQISDIGIELAIDDFGTGYSSLSYIKKLPIHKLKIDQSFIRDLPDDAEDSAITKAVISLAQNLNLNVIAEGVETVQQRDFLLKNGCNHIQGYFYSKPIDASKIEIILKEGINS